MLMSSYKLFLYSKEVHLNSGVTQLLELHCVIQLFCERLSCKRGRAYATMSKVIMGNSGF